MARFKLRFMVAKKDECGDTLIEVLLSMTILSLIIIGGNALMNVGTRNALTAVEHTQVRNSIVGQSELLHYLRDNAESSGPLSGKWRNDILTSAYVSAAAASPVNNCEPSNPSRAFFLQPAAAASPSSPPNINVVPYAGAAGSSGTPYAIAGRGLWIEGQSSTAAARPYTDFHIRACWKGTGGGIDQRSSTVVRLYTQ